MGLSPRCEVEFHPPREARRERLCGKLQWALSGRMPERALVPDDGARSPSHPAMEDRIQHRETTQLPGRSVTRGVCKARQSLSRPSDVRLHCGKTIDED